MKKFARFWKDKERPESGGADSPAPFTDIQRAASPEPRLSYIKHDSRRRSDRFSLRRRRQLREAPPRRAESCETLYEAPSSPAPRAPTDSAPGSPGRRARLSRGAAGSAEDLARGGEPWRRSGSAETLQGGRRSGSGTRLGWSWRWKRSSSSDRSAADVEGPASARAGPPAVSLDDFLGSVLSVSAGGAERVQAERDPPVSPDQGYRSSGRSTEELHRLAGLAGSGEAMADDGEVREDRQTTAERRQGGEEQQTSNVDEERIQREQTSNAVADRVSSGGATTGRNAQALRDRSGGREDTSGGYCDGADGYPDAVDAYRDRDIASEYRSGTAGIRGNEPRSRGSVLGLFPDEPISLEQSDPVAAPVSERGTGTSPAVHLQTNLTPVRRPSLPRTPRHPGATGCGGGGMYRLADSPPSSDETADAATEDDSLSAGAEELRAAQRRCQQAWRAAGVPAAPAPPPGVPVPALRYRPAPPYRELDPLGGSPPVPPPQRDRPPPYQPRAPDRAEQAERREEAERRKEAEEERDLAEVRHAHLAGQRRVFHRRVIEGSE